MTPKQACLNLLGLSQRAQKQIAGEDLALVAIRNQSAKLVFIASDAGPTTAKKFHDKAQFYEVPVIDTFTKAELNAATGKKRTIIAITDAGFAKKMVAIMTN
ncbi:YlxQ-related RNA-binding protein [Lactiplantibacillus mudanjiangensis]|uniref:Ribosomal protein HS6-type (S12/L30/L7a) [Lactobacillus plantarum JDM1] n=1 Tax=Lactiplantibacillus mudanjiangensis TaxID=1296538 RepID=A0A660E8B4_9LACO|nr:YlxQ-related RNA-binding protein [Lactiplantibacillus mudanjiangensis]VDG20578.1 ribosomal protein HS6-type (S12/L30/L7a) [Lactobacillus plantarum JDM1] [Lactiplantibacillus mudanjiangensis]VDG24569.1 ribosomal protein HS6-type (S12/L30/L7a) [Lactobacillus plantarum JDM1] [Lactiplantibacillus mudanjiangensis]VDG28617.1 ribosomal protein HS6-type (S12/L30/L7a) [Lactobacillus plantarum JDM1] [Lactiplantibacillus mudanjiangensis]VDG30684.1 ribosomal protein HS6-type (S12/L30/L7a) [Lactobacillus